MKKQTTWDTQGSKLWKKHFYGIVGHFGPQIDGWQTAQNLANYWRDHFGVPREGETFPNYGEQEGSTSAEVSTAMPVTDDGTTHEPGTLLSPTESDVLHTPRAIMQLALVLNSILSLQPPEDLASLRALQDGGNATGTTVDFRDLNLTDFSLLSGHLAIVSHRLAQQAAAEQEIPDDSDG